MKNETIEQFEDNQPILSWDENSKGVRLTPRGQFSKTRLQSMGKNLVVVCTCVILIIFTGVAAWRLAWANVTVDLSAFEFSDLLALIMGIFAIAMSVAFYFKATDTSNKFYDNVYKFTQDTSEILGRIEAGFGERLRHLDEGYSGLQSRFDKFSLLSPEESEKKVEKNKEREAEAKARIQETIDEKQKILNDLAERAKLEAQEKEKLFSELKQLEEKNNEAERRLLKLQKERDSMAEQMNWLERDMYREGSEVKPLLRDILAHSNIRFLLQQSVPFETVQTHFKLILSRLSRHDVLELQKHGILSEQGELTWAGRLALKAIMRANTK